MKWIEFIRVQTTGFEQESVSSRLFAIDKNFEKSPGLSAADVYAHTSGDGDFAVSL